MKQTYIRALWGIYDTQGRRFWQRREKLDDDVKLVLKNPIQVPFTTYTFGEDNHKYLIDQGVNSVMIDKRPYVWDMDTQQFRHKLEVFKAGMEESDEIVFLDWDTLPLVVPPQNIWDEQRKRMPFQSLLRTYKKKKATWRKDCDWRKVPCASYVYIREKEITTGIIKTWEKLGKPMSEETAIAKYFDDLMGGWKGLQYWWDNYETMYFHLEQGRVWEFDQIAKKTKVFEHFNYHAVDHKLNEINKKSK